MLLSTGYFHLAKTLVVGHSALKEDRSGEDLGELLNTMNMEPLDWPADDKRKLVPLDVPLNEKPSLSLLLNDDMLSMINGAISKFCSKVRWNS